MSKMMMVVLAVLLLSACGMGLGGSNGKLDLPELKMKVGDDEYMTARGSYCWGDGSFAECADTSGDPFDFESLADKISVEAGTVAELEFSVPPQSAHVTVQAEGEEGAPVSTQPLRLPDEPGRYGYTVFAEWPEGDVSYFFIVEVE